MANKDQIIELLAQGISPSQVATVVGVEDSYISQLLADEDFALQVAEKQQALTERDIRFDETLQAAEAKALENIDRRLPLANLQQSLQAFKVLNTARHRKDSRIMPQNQGAGIVVAIQVPVTIAPTYVLNQKSEIVEVDGKTMVSASPKQLENLAAAKGITAPNPSRAQPTQKLLEAQEVLQTMNTAPTRRLSKAVPDSQLADLL